MDGGVRSAGDASPAPKRLRLDPDHTLASHNRVPSASAYWRSPLLRALVEEDDDWDISEDDHADEADADGDANNEASPMCSRPLHAIRRGSDFSSAVALEGTAAATPTTAKPTQTARSRNNSNSYTAARGIGLQEENGIEDQFGEKV